MTAGPRLALDGSARLLTVAVAHGAVAGALAAATLTAMHLLQRLVWVGDEGPLRIALTILAGGVLITLLRHREHGEESLESVLAASEDPIAFHWRRALHLTALSVTAVAFGGAVGPEAGLIAIVTELSAIVTRRIACTREEARRIGELGAAAALGGLYGSPPAGAAWSDDSLTGRKVPHLVAAAAGLLGFLLVHHLTSGGPVHLGIPAVAGEDRRLVLTLVPALAGAFVAALFALGQPVLASLVGRLPGGPAARAMAATAAVALLAAAVPSVRFSGHEELSEVARLLSESAWGDLATLAVLKLLATALCLRGGWLGGVIFPLLYAGAAAGAATTALLPALDAGSAIVAGLTAAAVVGLRKPLAAVLVCAFVVGGGAWGPLAVALVVGSLVGRRLPEPAAH